VLRTLHNLFGSYDVSGVPLEPLCQTGGVASTVALATRERSADVIVIGPDLQPRLKTLVNGSVVDDLIAFSTIPILIAGPNVCCELNFKRILYVTALMQSDAAAMRVAVSLAGAYDASLLMLHVNHWHSKEPPKDAVTKTRDFISEQIRSFGIGAAAGQFDLIVEFGAESEKILQVASDDDIDLIVMPADRRTSSVAQLSRRLGASLVHQVTAQARCPVLAA